MDRGAYIQFGRNPPLPRDRTRIVAIINVSYDSFSGDGSAATDDAVTRVGAALAAGATLIDIGAESTRPGSEAISADEEIRRLMPALAAIRRAHPAALLSLDTTKATVYAEAASFRPCVVNCVAGLPAAILDIALATESSLVITDPGGAQGGGITAICDRLTSLAQQARSAGMAAARIILDPGFGFGKTPDEHVALLRELAKLNELGYPTMLGASRKSLLGRLTANPVEQREHATTVTTTLAALARIDLVRVHAVAAAREALAVADAVARDLRPDAWISA